MSQGSIFSGASTVVWRPGGVTSGNVYATWPEVVAAVAKLNGAITIAYDRSIALGVIPAGAWDLRPAGVTGPVDIVNGTSVAFLDPFITIANAAVTIHGLTGLTGVLIDNESTSDVITTTPTNEVNFYMRGDAAIFQNVNAGGAAFFRAATGFLNLYMQDFSFISSIGGGTNAIRTTNPGFLSIFIEDSATLDTNQLTSTGAIVLVSGNGSPGFLAYRSQAGAPNITPLGMREVGSTPIDGLTGKSLAIIAFVNANTRIECTQRVSNGDGGATPTVRYAALITDRVNGNPGSFKISALTNVGGGAVNPAGASTVDWEVVTS